jgi:hypothetical protein
MSVCISAFFSHRWSQFSKPVIDALAEAASLECAPAQYKRISQSKSKRKEFARDGSVTFLLPDDFSVRLGQKVLELEYDHRWGRLLMYKTVRLHFIAACTRVAEVAGAKEALVIPEGTILADALYEDISFEQIKQRAFNEWGPPDLDVTQFLTAMELCEMPYDRVHYFLIPICPKGAGKIKEAVRTGNH